MKESRDAFSEWLASARQLSWGQCSRRLSISSWEYQEFLVFSMKASSLHENTVILMSIDERP